MYLIRFSTVFINALTRPVNWLYFIPDLLLNMSIYDENSFEEASFVVSKYVSSEEQTFHRDEK